MSSTFNFKFGTGKRSDPLALIIDALSELIHSSTPILHCSYHGDPKSC